MPDFKHLDGKGNMSLFTTGYFSLSQNDLKNLKVPSGFNKNNNYSIVIEKCSKIAFILFIITELSKFFVFLFTIMFLEKSLFCLTIIPPSLYFIMLIVLNFFSIKEIIIMRNKIFKLIGYLPSFLFDDVDKMKSPDEMKRFWINLSLLIYHIPYAILASYFLYKERNFKNGKYILNKRINNTLLINEETKTPSKDFEITPTPID